MKREMDALVMQMHTAGLTYTESIRLFKKRYILEVLSRHKGNQCKAAAELRMHRNTLSRTLAELDMDTAQIRRGMRRPVTSEHSAVPGRPMAVTRERPRVVVAPRPRQA